MEFPESYLPRRIARAADEEMEQVLAEDHALRMYGHASRAETDRRVRRASRQAPL